LQRSSMTFPLLALFFYDFPLQLVKNSMKAVEFPPQQLCQPPIFPRIKFN
jgi:hypothetical protein